MKKAVVLQWLLENLKLKKIMVWHYVPNTVYLLSDIFPVQAQMVWGCTLNLYVICTGLMYNTCTKAHAVYVLITSIRS